VDLGGLCREFALLRTVATGQVSVAHDERIASICVFWLDEVRLSEPLVAVTYEGEVLRVEEVEHAVGAMHVVHYRSSLEQQVLESSICSLGVGVTQVWLKQCFVLLKQSLGCQQGVWVVITNRNAVVSGAHLCEGQRSCGVFLV